MFLNSSYIFKESQMSNELKVIEQIIETLSHQEEKQSFSESEVEEEREQQTGLFTDVDYCSKINDDYEAIKKSILSRRLSTKLADSVSKSDDQTGECIQVESNSSRHRTDDNRFYDNHIADAEKEDGCFNLSEEVDKRDTNLSRSYYDNLNNELQVDQIEKEVSDQSETCLETKKENQELTTKTPSSIQEPFVLNETLLVLNEQPNVEYNLEKFERLLEKLTQMQEQVLNECELESDMPKIVADLKTQTDSVFDEYKEERETLNDLIDQVERSQNQTGNIDFTLRSIEHVGEGTNAAELKKCI
jgi:hypothetical protein